MIKEKKIEMVGRMDNNECGDSKSNKISDI